MPRVIHGMRRTVVWSDPMGRSMGFSGQGGDVRDPGIEIGRPDGMADGLVLVDAAGWLDAPGEGESDPFIFKLLRNGVARSVMKDLDMSALIRSGLEDSFYDPAFVTDEMVDRYSAMSRAPCVMVTLPFPTTPSFS